MKKDTAKDKGPNHEQIAARAYQIWEASERAPGSEMKNWLEAEKELRSATVGNGAEDSGRAIQKPTAPAISAPSNKFLSIQTVRPKQTSRQRLAAA
jgi:hypothetical protein